MYVAAIERGGPCSFVTGIASDLQNNWLEWLKLSLPALLYTIQNNALFLGLANLEATVAQVTRPHVVRTRHAYHQAPRAARTRL